MEQCTLLLFSLVLIGSNCNSVPKSYAGSFWKRHHLSRWEPGELSFAYCLWRTVYTTCIKNPIHNVHENVSLEKYEFRKSGNRTRINVIKTKGLPCFFTVILHNTFPTHKNWGWHDPHLRASLADVTYHLTKDRTEQDSISQPPIYRFIVLFFPVHVNQTLVQNSIALTSSSSSTQRNIGVITRFPNGSLFHLI